MPADATGAVKLTNNGTLSVVNTISAPTSANISVSNNGAIDVSVGTTQIEGTQSTTKYETVKKLTSDTHEITEGGFYDGTGVTIDKQVNFNGQYFDYALYISTSEKVVISGLTIKGNIQGILVSKDSDTKRDLTLVNSTIAGNRALCVRGKDNNITIKNCNLLYLGLNDYNTEVANGKQGILIRNTGSTLDVQNSKIQGFTYSIYTSDAGDITINMTDSVFKGRAGLALYNTNNLVANVRGCKIHGINGFTGKTEVYGNLTTQNVDDNNTKIVFNVSDCEFSVYRLPATTNNYQYAISVDFGNTKVNLSGNNTFVGEIRYAEDLTTEELKSKAYDIISDTRDGNNHGNNGFTSVVMTISSANDNSVVVKVK